MESGSSSLPVVDARQRQSLLLRAMASQEAKRRQIVDACREWKVSHSAGPMFWLRKHTKTENKQWREQGLEQLAPFPYEPYPLATWSSGCTADHIHIPERCAEHRLKALPFQHDFTPADLPDYLDIAMGFLLLCLKELYIPKTREMMTSWLVVGFITWYCQFFEQTEWLSQSEDDLKAQGLIKYANALYTNQPEWLRSRFPLVRGDEGTLHKIEWAHGSNYRALPSGIRKLASSHPTGYFNDETAHQPAAKATIGVAMPAVRQVVAVSSVAPGWFWQETKPPDV